MLSTNPNPYPELGKSHGRRKYNVNDFAFNKLDNENVAYWLGFIYADGCVATLDSRVPNVLSVQIDAYDQEHIEKLKVFLQAENPVHLIHRKADKFRGKEPIKKEHDTALIAIYSRQIAYDLIQYGIVKDRIAFDRLRNSLPLSLFPHWLRGYTDGDGYIDNKHPRITIVGQIDLITWIRGNLHSMIGCEETATIGQSNLCKTMYSISYKGNISGARIIRWLYQNSSTYLDRKYERAKLWI